MQEVSTYTCTQVRHRGHSNDTRKVQHIKSISLQNLHKRGSKSQSRN